ncbi:hypothetical protein GXW83_15580 [Streptacidiphilus sp. PB12-B1b]|uniref:hypothetical protein n=1 Tax=Streptacidiphilus sp. PB12-B1b TaxID=2705012 RepID=UPI0015FD30C4|nr:hypothetical protein [Streptacidiphilus sp. PB12-B1b]QMU76928.1 hypothetical protein GXW83_15580 [Streptacidiphilus sp. PB12-B1b]
MPEHHRPQSEAATAFRVGPFGEALRTAIDHSGLSLARVSRRLAERGVTLSPAALSYWQRGSNRPERAESLRAVSLLEEILGLPSNTLMALLGPPRARGRWTAAAADPVPTSALWPAAGRLNRTLTAVEEDARRRLWAVSTVYTHVHEQVTAARTFGRTRVRKVVRAEVDGVDRIIAVMRTDGAPTRFEAVHAVRLGRMRSDPQSGYSVAEFILDRVLNRGDTATVEYLSSYRAVESSPQNYTRHSLYRPADVLVIEVEFHPEAIPAKCEGFYSPRRETPERNLGPLWIGNSNSVHLALSDLPPGMYGLRWEWD